MLVIGNGESRKEIDINKCGKIKVGCNAIFRDFYVNHLICCDRRMVEEAQKERNYGAIYTRPDWKDQFKLCGLVPELPYKGNTRLDEPWHWGSGPYAVLLAAIIASRVPSNPDIHMIGFDLDSESNTVNNIYKGTKNYLSETSKGFNTDNWTTQLIQIFKDFPETKFYWVVNEDASPLVCNNVKSITYKDLDKLCQV